MGKIIVMKKKKEGKEKNLSLSLSFVFFLLACLHKRKNRDRFYDKNLSKVRR
jgi:hypothetical protein